MAQARFYKDRPVKRMWRCPEGIRLVLLSDVAGQPGKQLIVTQAEWDQHGELWEVASTRRGDLRNLARR